MADDPQSRVIEHLSRGAVGRFETHVSIVFLTGERALKLKKAVKFPYLDYSTIEKRKFFCEREVELNRRTAPQLYLGAEPVTIDGKGPLRRT